MVISNSTVSSITFNGSGVTTLIFNGVTVWSASAPPTPPTPTTSWVQYSDGDELPHGTVYGIRVDASTVPSEDPAEVYFLDSQTASIYSLVYYNGEWMDESQNPIAEEDGYYTMEFPNGVSVGTDYAPFDLELLMETS